MLPVREPETIRMAMPDGVRLAADVYRPVGPQRHPVLVMRLPYGRRIASTVVLAHPAWYAAQGYVVLVQDVRGRGDSQGAFRVLEDDAADGAATLALAADLDGGNGQVATYGFSYHGINQFLALAGAFRAGTRPPDAMAVVMAAFDPRDHWAYEGGALRLELNQHWAGQMAIETAGRAGDIDLAEALRHAGPLHGGPVPARPALLAQAGRHTHYHDWLADDPACWARISPRLALAGETLDVPVLHVGGWTDFMLEGTLDAFQTFERAGAPGQRLRVGPWAHLPWGRRTGTLDGGAAAADGIDRDIVAIFRAVLKGEPAPSPAIRLFDPGLAVWRDFDRWPATRERVMVLSSQGRAAPTTTDGRLVEEPGPAAVDHLVHDPWRPAPSVGLHLGTPPGYVDRAAVDDRADVAIYTSPPLDAPMTLLGAPVADLFVTADRPSFDLHVTLSMVAPDGEAIGIASGHLSAGGGERAAVRFRPVCFTVPAGLALRLSVQAAAFPAFAVNPGTGARPQDAAALDALPITLAIRSGGERASALTLPVLTEDGDR